LEYSCGHAPIFRFSAWLCLPWACLCFMPFFALVCSVVGWCHRCRLLCSGCFAAITLLGRMLCCRCCLGGCFAVDFVLVPPMADALLLRVCGPSCGCFAAAIVLAPLAHALPPRSSLVAFAVPLADALPPRLSLVADAVFTTLLATIVLRSCIRLSRWGF
jgi:hypothetical protein